MIRADCHTCGATFHLDDALAGRRVKCKRCGTIFTVPDVASLASDTELLAVSGEDDDPLRPLESEPAAGGPEATPTEAPFLLNHAARPDAQAQARQTARDVITEPTRSFWADAGISFVVPFRGPNVFLFVFLILFMVVRSFLQYALCVGAIGQMIITCWLFTYYFLIIQTTCMGEDQLPRFELEGGLLDGFILPFCRYVGTALWVGLPFLVWSGIINSRPVLPGNGDVIIWAGLLGLALFLWPMALLTVAIQGFSSDLLRYDKQLLTIGRSFLPYLVICGMLTLLTPLPLLTMGLGQHVGIGGLGGMIAIQLFGTVLDAYVTLIAMRLIGLFYRHNKRRFAWLAE